MHICHDRITLYASLGGRAIDINIKVEMMVESPSLSSNESLATYLQQNKLKLKNAWNLALIVLTTRLEELIISMYERNRGMHCVVHGFR
jgi:hypothetical protein